MARTSREQADAPRFGAFQWIGEHPSVDFVNTVTWRTYGLRRERFGTFRDVVTWATDAFKLKDSRQLSLFADHHPEKAAHAFDRACALRSTLHALFGAVVAGAALPDAELDAFNRMLRSTLGRTSLEGSRRLHWDWESASNPLVTVTDRVVWSAASLLTSEDVRFLRQCANPECGWLFLDRSRKRNRRWCGLECSSQAKSSRYYARIRKLRTAKRRSESAHAAKRAAD
jgi:predicted RNA-binding Zn ribbon-like protein